MSKKQPELYPLSLAYEYDNFKSHYEVANGEPILLVGASGVGKSIFLRSFRELFAESSGNEGEILSLDCSHFVGADPAIARSELFGHKKNSFTGAITDKEGMVKKADGGALILDEVGELPDTVQAMLLTFVETGLFRPVGGDEFEEASTQIIAATNREEQLREELRYRFFPFYISPLHRRREDILPYFAFKFEDLIKELYAWEIMLLMSYHWPGNVREIERVGKMMLFNKKINIRLPGIKDESLLAINDKRVTGLNTKDTIRLLLDLRAGGVDGDLLEKILNRYGLGLNTYNDYQPFKSIESPVWISKGQEGEMDMSPEYGEILDKINRGFRSFCHLLCLEEQQNDNLLTLGESWEFVPVMHALFLDFNEFQNKGGVKTLPLQVEKYLADRSKKQKDPVIHPYSYDSLRKKYFGQLLNQTNGNVSQAAIKAGLNVSTMRSKMDGLEVLYKRN